MNIQRLWDTRIVRLFFTDPGAKLWSEYRKFCTQHNLECLDENHHAIPNGLMRTPAGRYINHKCDIYQFFATYLRPIYEKIEHLNEDSIIDVVFALGDIDTSTESHGKGEVNRQLVSDTKRENKRINLEQKRLMDFKEESNRLVAQSGVKRRSGKPC